MTDDLIERLLAGERSNKLDVLIEVALFKPDRSYKAARTNAAGTKVIYTSVAGYDSTHWADDWSHAPERTVALLSKHGERT